MSELCRLCKVTKDTVRYYHRYGILMYPPKNINNGYSNYNEKHIERLRFIKKLQSFGFSLKEIKDAILLEENNLMSDEIRISTLNQKLIDVTEKLKVLSEYKKFLLTALKNLKNKN
jgi:DNA-binding transcriptional MerR regulator